MERMGVLTLVVDEYLTSKIHHKVISPRSLTPSFSVSRRWLRGRGGWRRSVRYVGRWSTETTTHVSTFFRSGTAGERHSTHRHDMASLLEQTTDPTHIFPHKTMFGIT